MFARVSQAHYPPVHYDAGLRILVEELLPAFQEVAGYHGCCVLADGKPGTGLAVVLWETEEDADAAAAERGVAKAHVKLAALGLAINSRQLYEVIALDTWTRGIRSWPARPSNSEAVGSRSPSRGDSP